MVLPLVDMTVVVVRPPRPPPIALLATLHVQPAVPVVARRGWRRRRSREAVGGEPEGNVAAVDDQGVGVAVVVLTMVSASSASVREERGEAMSAVGAR